MSRIADLILARGSAEAQGQRNSGAIWGNTVSNLGQIAAQGVQDFGANREAERAKQAQQQQDAELQRLFSSEQMPSPEDLIRTVGPERGMKLAQGLQAFTELRAKKVTDQRSTAGRLALAMQQLSPEMRTQMWPAVREAAIAGGLGQADQLPEQADDQFLNGIIAWATEKAPEKPKGPEPFTLGEGQTRFGPDGQPIANVPKPPEAPKPPTPVKVGTEEDFIARFAKELGKPLEELTTAQIASARRKFAQQTRFVEPKDEKPTGPSAYSAERSTRVLQSVDELDKLVSNWTTGFGSMFSRMPTSDARTFARKLDTLKANIAFNELTQMREASKTGGALGGIAIRELELLENTLGALDPGMDAGDFKAELKKVRESVNRWTSASGGGNSAPLKANDPLGIR